MGKSTSDILKGLINSRSRTILCSRIDEYLVKNVKVRFDGWLHISGLGYEIDEQAKGILGLKKANQDPKLERIFGMGHGIHSRYDEYLKGMAERGIIKLLDLPSSIGIPGVECPMRDEEDKVTGTADAIIEIAGLVTVVDFKSINSNGFSRLQTEAKPEHVMQLKGYGYYGGKTGLVDIDQGLVLYENKDTQEIKEFLVSMDDLSEVPERVKQVWDAVKLLSEEEE